MPLVALTEFADATLKLSTPLLFASLGEMIGERAGIINIGTEGLILTAAFTGFWAALTTGNPYVGVAAGMLSAMGLSLLFGMWVIYCRADQIVAGTAVNLLALGLTGALYRGLYGETGSALAVKMLPSLTIPGLSSLPIVGPAIFQQNGLVYLALLLVPALAFALYRTGWGLSLRAVGEEPKAADTAGVPVLRVRYGAVLLAGALAGLGGVFLSIAHANTFTEGMSSGRGFIALAIVIFGRWTPWGVLGASMLFGAANALQFALQSQGYALPYQFLLALPYLVTLIVLTGTAGRSRAPAALAQPYMRQ
jgi:simple sugar transport system permease protein